jgi:hypothetical protein
MKNAAQNLTEARKLVEKPECWTKGEYARDEENLPTFVRAENAKCFCVLGAISRASGVHPLDLEDTPEYAAFASAADMNPARFNDGLKRQHSEILETFDRAIELAAR